MAGIPYRTLWHAYCLTKYSSNSADHLVLTSQMGINPEEFVFTPLDEFGNSPVKCNAAGIARVLFVPEFDRDNTTIYVNQPKGSMNLDFEWHYKYDLNTSVLSNLVIHGSDYLGSVYHALILFSGDNE